MFSFISSAKNIYDTASPVWTNASIADDNSVHTSSMIKKHDVGRVGRRVRGVNVQRPAAVSTIVGIDPGPTGEKYYRVAFTQFSLKPDETVLSHFLYLSDTEIGNDKKKERGRFLSPFLIHVTIKITETTGWTYWHSSKLFLLPIFLDYYFQCVITNILGNVGSLDFNIYCWDYVGASVRG